MSQHESGYVSPWDLTGKHVPGQLATDRSEPRAGARMRRVAK